MTWPSARRTSDGGWLSPESLNSPSSSTPSASLGALRAKPDSLPEGRPDSVRWALAGSATALTGLHLSRLDQNAAVGCHKEKGRPDGPGGPPNRCRVPATRAAGRRGCRAAGYREMKLPLRLPFRADTLMRPDWNVFPFWLTKMLEKLLWP